MVKILCIGDPHFSKSRLGELDNIIEKIIIAANKLEPELIIIMGDLLDSHEKGNIYVRDKAITLLKRLHEKYKIALIIGNHDRPNNSDFQSNLHFFSGLEYWPQLFIIDKASYIKLNEKIIWLIPYVPPGEFNKAIETLPEDIKKETPLAIFCHQEFYGVQLGPHKSKKGDKWSLDSPLIISGHIHNYHWLQKNILYIGSPYQIAFSEDSDKAVVLLEFSDSPLPKIRRFSLGLPPKKTLFIPISSLDTSSLPNNDPNTKIIITGDYTDIQSKKNQLQKLTSQPLMFKPDPTILLNKFEDKSFKNILYDLVKENENSLLAYNKIFI